MTEPTNAKQAYQLNLQIEETIRKKGTNPNAYTQSEKLQLMMYSGMGGLQKQGATGKGLLYEYFTPDPVVKKMWSLCLKYGFKGGNILEPSAGVGAFLKHAPQTERGNKFTAHEINDTSMSILRICYPTAMVQHQYFEQRFISAQNTSIKDKVVPNFDLVIGNPPYGDVKGSAGSIYFNMGEREYSKAMAYDEYFILRGLDSLKSGGLLCYIIGAEVANGGIPFLDKGTSKAKEAINDRGELIDAYRLPNGIFDRTDVLSDIIVFRKY